MGRPRVKRRQLTTEEQKQATRLMEQHIKLANHVARQCWREFQLWDNFSDKEISEVAYLALCEAATDYVRKGFDFSLECEIGYLADAIRHDIVDFVRRERRIRTAKQQAEEGGTTRRLIPLEEYMAYEEDHAEFLREETQERALPVNALEVFAKTLPTEERAMFEELQRDANAKQYRTPDELAKALGICRSLFFERRRSIKEKLHWWLKGYKAA